MRLVKVGAAIVNQTPFDWDNNQRNITAAIERARAENITILCLPELCVTGYGCEDDYFRPDLQHRAWSVLQKIAPATQGMVVSLGLPVFYNNALFNCAALLVDGKVAGIVAKKNLAGDGIHYEPRWFESWQEGAVVRADVYGEKLPFGDIYFNVGGIKIGFEICEEAWVGQRPGGKLSAKAVDLLLNPSASHFCFGKFAVRKRLVLEGSRAFGGTYIYTNLLGNEAGRAIYDGGAMIAQSGELLAVGPRLLFADYHVTSSVIDVEITRMRQSRTFSFMPDMDPTDYDCVDCDFDYPEIPVPPPVFVSSDHQRWESTTNVREEEFARAVSLGLFDYLRKSYSRGYVVSLSGGADSTAVACLVSLMVEIGVRELGLKPFLEKLAHIKDIQSCHSTKEIIGQILTCAYQATRNSGDVTKNAAKAVAEAIGARFYSLDIDPLVQQYNQLAETALGRKLDWKTDDIAMQNIQARVRSPGIWYIANLMGAILLSTSNRSEGAVGYCTMDGDTSGGLSPIAGIDKDFLRQWLRWLQEKGPEGLSPIPALSCVTQQSPTAELRPQEAAQTDEKDLMPYDVLEEIETLAIEDNRSPVECYALLRNLPSFRKYNPRQLAGWIERFFRLWSINQWKRERLAPALHVDTRNLDPRTWRRSPILSGGFRRELADMWVRVEKDESDAGSRPVRRALIRVDMQNDFMPSGALAVGEGDQIVPLVNILSECGLFDLRIDTQDFHPADHCSFSTFAPHCVQGSKGAEFHTELVRHDTDRVFRKAAEKDKDSFSGFGNVELEPFLRSHHVDEIYVVGLATDYCVKMTALDAAAAGFRTVVIIDACRAVNPADVGKTVDELKAAGIKVIESSELIGPKVKLPSCSE